MTNSDQADTHARSNIVLIGMPGAGKSTIGLLLAKAISKDFVDTDVVIQVKEGMALSAIIAEKGLDAFRDIEAKHLREFDVDKHVIATGGSAIYSNSAMESLKKQGLIIYLHLGLDALTQRLGNLDSRGVVRKKGQDLAGLCEERCPLYEQYADVTIYCDNKTQETLVNEIKKQLEMNI